MKTMIAMINRKYAPDPVLGALLQIVADAAFFAGQYNKKFVNVRLEGGANVTFLLADEEECDLKAQCFVCYVKKYLSLDATQDPQILRERSGEFSDENGDIMVCKDCAEDYLKFYKHLLGEDEND